MGSVKGLHHPCAQEVLEQLEAAKVDVAADGARCVACVVLLDDDSVQAYYCGKLVDLMGTVEMLRDVLQEARREGEA
jgi:aerobic-type carbon monoxide dehydrogenase small subunit (CoxS/CutS family)